MSTELPTKLEQPLFFKAARILLAEKEHEIELALDFYYKTNDWPMAHLSENAVMEYRDNGTEIFKVAGVELLYFGHLTTEVDAEGNSIRCRVNQEFRRLYEA